MAVNALSKMGLKELGFLSKSSNFVHFGQYDLVQISPACSPNTYQIMYGETLDLQCKHLQRQHGKVFKANLLQKIIFRSGILGYHY